MKQIGLRSYQDIKTPEEEREELEEDSLLESMLEEYDSELGSFAAYKSNCIREIRRMKSAK